MVVIGGGTGLSSILRGLKEYTDDLTAVVTMGDDGGSSGRLRDDLGLLPPGDIRNCILALADDETVMTELFNYRFKMGELGGHSFGNLFLAAMDGISDDFYQAIKRTSDVLDIIGRVLPVSLDPMILQARLKDGTFVEGESNIPKAVIERRSPIDRLILKDQKRIEPLEDTLEAIRRANIIILGPGSLYTSLISNLLVPGIVESIKASRASKRYYMGNLMTQPGETDGYNQSDHLRAIRKHMGEANVFTSVIQHNGIIPEKTLAFYRTNNQIPVEPMNEGEGYRIITENLVHVGKGNVVRHNTERAAQIMFEDFLGKTKR